jgi:hypothetical protein
MTVVVEAFWVLVGLAAIAAVYYVNRHLFKKRGGVTASGLELAYYAIGLVALAVGWYFNFAYLNQYGRDAGWWHWTTLLFVNPAAASAGQDLIIANLVLFPMWTILEGRRSDMKAPWIYFVASLVTSFAFGMALFLALLNRQRRWNENRMAATVIGR